MKRQIDSKTRAVYKKFHWQIMGPAHTLQRKVWWGWKVTAFASPMTLDKFKGQNSSITEFLYAMERNKNYTEIDLGIDQWNRDISLMA